MSAQMEVDVGEVVKSLKAKAPADIQDYFVQFEDYYDRKLWHQMTVKIMEFMLLPSAKPFLIPLYEKFISVWEKKMKKTFLVQIAIVTARQYPDARNAMKFMESIVEKVKDDSNAYVLANMETAHYKLVLNDAEGTRAIMDDCQKILDGLSGVEPIIHAGFYRVCADFYKAKADYAMYYKMALLFLACVDANQISTAEKVSRAYDLALSALLGDTIYNFGELLLHPILDSLKTTQHEWLRNLLFVFNSGDIGKFDVLATNFTKQPLLSQNLAFLRQKLCLMALMELIFLRPGSSRRIPLSVIGKETRLPEDEIEHLLMKALSLGLIKGKIDQVDQMVEVEWVQPRVLDKKQIQDMNKRILEWSNRVSDLSKDLTNEAPELFKPIIKICGITNKKDAQISIDSGANLIGLIFVEHSKRHVDMDTAREIVQFIRANYARVELKNNRTSPKRLVDALQSTKCIGIVGVFQDQPLDHVQQVMNELDLDFCQLHGKETYENEIQQNVIKVIGISSADTVKTVTERLQRFKTSLILLDTATHDASGGTGKPFDWNIGRRLAGHRKNFMLAGGLNANNIMDAVKTGAWALDVSSGVEEAPGQKSVVKLKELFSKLEKKEGKKKSKEKIGRNEDVNVWREEMNAILEPTPKQNESIKSLMRQIEQRLSHVSISDHKITQLSISEQKLLKRDVHSVKNDGKKKRNRKPREKKPFFAAHLKKSEWEKLLVEKNSNIYQGSFRVNRRKRNLAYVSVEGFANDVVVVGTKDQNRALEGDSVILEIFGEAYSNDLSKINQGSKWFQQKKPSKLAVGESEESISESETDFEEVEGLEENVLHPLGRVVAIEERRPGRVYAGFLAENHRSGSNMTFSPSDKRAPLMLVSTNDIVDREILEDYEKFKDKIFVAVFQRWPEISRYPYGRLMKILGQVGEIMVETEAIIEGNSIRDVEFSAQVKACLPMTPWNIPEDEVERRKDLRKQCIFTIDPETAKDLDDAVSCKPLEDGMFEIGVHIADVSHFIPLNSPLDQEAFRRGTTTYLVQRAIPMLPAVLCEDLCSLNPGVDRLAFSVIWKMNSNAEISDTWFGRTVIRSCIKLNYGQAQKLIDGAEWAETVDPSFTPEHDSSEIVSNLKIFHRLSQIMRKRRFDGGALTINQPRLTFRLDQSGHPIQCHVYEIRDSNRLIEEFMLLANMSVAQRIYDHFPSLALLRCHPPPNDRTLRSFLAYTEKMGHHLNAQTAGALQQSIQSIEDPEVRQIFQLLAIKPMQRAKYICSAQARSPQILRHYALNVDLYTHFTSPIRRYADVLVHRLLQKALDNELDCGTQQEKNKREIQMIKSARQCNLKKEDARHAQDSSSKLFLCIYLKRLEEHLQRELVVDAIVMDFADKSFDAYIPEFALDRRVHFGDSGIISSTVNFAKNHATLFWPKFNGNELPPFYDPEAVNAEPKAVDNQFYETQYRKSSGDQVSQSLRILDHVKVRICLKGKSPLDVAAYLLHPQYDKPVIPSNVVLGAVESSMETILEETFEEVDG